MKRRVLALLTAFLGFGAIARAEPEIWFAPEDSVRSVQRGDPWKSDFMDLFPSEAPWKNAAGRVQVFQIYPQFLSKASDDDLRAVFEGLRQRHIALALSYGMLHRPPGAEMHEGYGAEIAERDIARLKRLKADLKYVVADEPLLFGHFFWGVGAPPLPITDLARDMASTARLFREAFPGVQIGMDDPIMLYKDREWAPAMKEFLEDFRTEFGEPMGCVRVECASFAEREWLPRYVAAADLFNKEGVGMGMLITGDATDATDHEWLAKAEARYAGWESGEHPAPAQVVFQSWMPRPSRLLPESDPDTHTHLIDGYFRVRSRMQIQKEKNGFVVRLATESGDPIGNAPLTVAVLPGFDDPAMVHRVLKGIAPDGAVSAQAGLRIGLEGSREGVAALSLNFVKYVEGTEEQRSMHLASLGFGKGWGKKGDATTVERNPTRTGEIPSLDIEAEAGQTLLLNSRKTPATPGSQFRFEFQARIQPRTETGFFVAFFFDSAGKVIRQIKEPFIPENARVVQQWMTDREGRVRIPFSEPTLKTAREIRLSFPGNDQIRPAFLSFPSALAQPEAQ